VPALRAADAGSDELAVEAMAGSNGAGRATMGVGVGVGGATARPIAVAATAFGAGAVPRGNCCPTSQAPAAPIAAADATAVLNLNRCVMGLSFSVMDWAPV